jgi:hypothetical protein
MATHGRGLIGRILQRAVGGTVRHPTEVSVPAA